MLRLHVPLPTRYLDFGKVFVPNGALDFSTLAASDADVARFGRELFNRGLVFPESSPFAAQIGAISAALLRYESGYLFTLVQRRREGELSTDPRTDRPFNQVRFVILSREQIEQAFGARANLYTSLALAARDTASRGWLHDYTARSEQPQPWSPVFERLNPEAPSPAAVRFVVDALVAAAEGSKPQPISVPLPGQDLLEKLRLVEAVQYWLMPRMGVLSFALDYVSIQNVHLRLFELPPDAPAPLPPERVFLPGPVDGRFTDSYHAPISGLDPESLFDPALPGLLGLNVTTAEAVSLFRVEKQAEPLPGAWARRLYPELAKLGERRFNLLRRVPQPDLLELLRQADLPAELRLDLLQVALDAAQGLLVLYAPAHLAVPRAARDDERVRALLRSSSARSPEASLGVGEPADQAELYHDLLLARRGPPFTGRGQPPPPPRVVLDTGFPVLDALLLGRRTPALASALAEVLPRDSALFNDALAVLDPLTDVEGLLWLWRSASSSDFKQYVALLERAVQPAWYPALARDAATWQQLLVEGRTAAQSLAPPADPAPAPDPTLPSPPTPLPAGPKQQPAPSAPAPGTLLRALPRTLVPFLWHACLAVAEDNAAFAEWWLFNEALALPEELPALWGALQKLPPAELPAAGPALNYLLGRAQGLSLLRACTPPGEAEPNEALYAAVLRGWLEQGFRSPVGELVLGTDDVVFLISHLPGSNDILAAVAASPAQVPAVRGLTPAQGLQWARATSGAWRLPYRPDDRDWLFQRLINLPATSEALLWHLLTVDEGSAPAVMPWSEYTAQATRVRTQAEALQLPPTSRLPTLLGLVGALQNPTVPETFAQNQIDIRRVFALLAAHAPEPARGADLPDSLMPLAVFHLQETNPDLQARAAALLASGLQQPEVQKQLHTMPDTVLTYLRDHICQAQPGAAPAEPLAATAHWIDAELARRKNAYRLEIISKAASPRRSDARPPLPAADGTPAGQSTNPPALTAPSRTPARSPSRARASAKNPNFKLPLTPPPPPPTSQAAGQPETASKTAPAPLLGQIALSGAAPKKADSAVWLWIAIVIIGILAVAIVIGALVWVQSLA